MVSGLKNGIYQSDVGATADAYFQCLQNGTVRTTFGYDHSDLSGKVSFGEMGTNDIIIFNATGGKFKGYGGAVSPSVGFVGEQITSSALSVPLTTSTTADVTSIDLTPGIWDISAFGYVVGNGQMATETIGISTISATLTGNAGVEFSQLTNFQATLPCGVSLVVPVIRAVLSITTTYYLVAQSVFTTGVVNCNGRITATRVA